MPQDLFARTPVPPYVAVIFTSRRFDDDGADYAAMAQDMAELAARQSGYLGVESVRDGSGMGITVSYWRDEASALDWKRNARHLLAQKLGKERWYEAYHVRIAKVTRAYEGP